MRVQVLEKRLLERRGELGQRDASLAAAPDRFVVHVGEVHHAMDVIAARFEVPLEQVFEDVRAEVADVRVAVNGRPAGIDLDGVARSWSSGANSSSWREYVL